MAAMRLSEFVACRWMDEIPHKRITAVMRSRIFFIAIREVNIFPLSG
jgi:hypothetical protein